MNGYKTQNLLTQLDRIEVMRDELLDEVKILSNDHIKHSPSEGKWSVIEIIEHLVLGEEYVLRSLFGNKPLVHQRRKPYHFIRYYIVMGILASSFNVRTPSKKMNPTSKVSLKALTDRWEQSHCILRDYLKGLDSETVHHAVFFHPICGPLTPKKALAMLEVHLKRHWKQIREILSK